MIVFTDYIKTEHVYEVKRKDSLPDMDMLLEEKNPFVFMALEYADVPIGFVCYNFSPHAAFEYSRIPNLTSVLSN